MLNSTPQIKLIKQLNRVGMIQKILKVYHLMGW